MEQACDLWLRTGGNVWCMCVDQIFISGLLSVSVTKCVDQCSVKCNHVFENHALYWGRKVGGAPMHLGLPVLRNTGTA